MKKPKIFITHSFLALLITVLEVLFLTRASLSYKPWQVFLLLYNFFALFGFRFLVSSIFKSFQSGRMNKKPYLQIEKQLLKVPLKDTFKLIGKKYTEFGDFDGYIIEASGIRFIAKSVIDLQTLNNIVNRKTYDFIITRPTIIIDIGANVGYSSLWFANKEQVKRVYGFEPVLPTYEQALQTISLNPQLQKKIELKNFGLSNNDQETTISYDPNHSTISSTIFSVQDNFEPEEYSTKISIKLVDAKPIFLQIANRKLIEDDSLVLKMDCEGCEYQIFECFDPYIWNSIDVIMMEIHGHDYERIHTKLIQQGFSVFSINHQNHPVFEHLCDVYAIRTPK